VVCGTSLIPEDSGENDLGKFIFFKIHERKFIEVTKMIQP
jgi:hypothetical protein